MRLPHPTGIKTPEPKKYQLALLILGALISLASKKLCAEQLEFERELVSLATAETSFQTSFFYEKTGLPKGGVIIAYRQAPQPFYLNNIAYVLAKHGWSTILVGIKTNTRNTSPEDTLPDNLESPTATTGMTHYTAILDETIRYMQEEKGQYNLVILAHGPSWSEINSYISTPDPKESLFQGLVMLNVQNHDHRDDVDSLKGLPTELPVLDLVTARYPDKAFQQRGVEAKRFKFDSYTQINLPSRLTLTTLDEDRLAKRIRGWLRLHIHGMELNKKFTDG